MKHLSDNSKTDKMLKCYVTSSEYAGIKADFESSGYRSLSPYVRKRLLGKGIMMHQPKLLLAKLDAVGTAINRIGNNVNQITKMAHLAEKEGKLPVSVLQNFNAVMTNYNEIAKELSQIAEQIQRRHFPIIQVQRRA